MGVLVGYKFGLGWVGLDIFCYLVFCRLLVSRVFSHGWDSWCISACFDACVFCLAVWHFCLWFVFVGWRKGIHSGVLMFMVMYGMNNQITLLCIAS